MRIQNAESHLPKGLLVVELNEFIGHSPAKIDEKGRLKIPQGFRTILENKFGPDCFITSEDGERAIVFPLPVWLERQAKLAKVPSSSKAKQRYLERVMYFGQVTSIDAQGRVLVPAVLRSLAKIADDVVVLGVTDHLIVWNDQKAQERVLTPMTDEDFKELELHGI